MPRARQGLFEDVLDVASKLPWWVSLLIAVISYFVLRYFASQEVTPGANAEESIAKGFAIFGQSVLPFLFSMGAILSFVGKVRRERLFDQVKARSGMNPLLDLGWRDFERLVGEAFRRRGYSVVENDSPGADGGVDLVLTRGGEKFLVQCKRWKATMVGVDIVRELFGVMAARGAVGGFIVTSGSFSPDARAFAEGRNIELIAGDKLLALIQEVKGSDVSTEQQARQMSAAPACPSCGREMVKRVAKRGSNAGKSFWGCSTYPRCTGTRDIV
ncbi:MAG: restriction endonuclease [Burkholderiales bacterium]